MTKREYEMTEGQLAEILDAGQPRPVLKIGDYFTPSPQERANQAWAALGGELGFKYMTAEPVPGKDMHFFMAEAKDGEES